MASERPWARFRVRIYRADGLPTMDAGIMAKMANVTDRTVFIDPYVRVTFAGQQVGRIDQTSYLRVFWYVRFIKMITHVQYK